MKINSDYFTLKMMKKKALIYIQNPYKNIFQFSGNGGYDQMNQIHDYSQSYAPPSSQSGYNANGYSQYSQQNYSQTTEYDQNHGYSQDYK